MFTLAGMAVQLRRNTHKQPVLVHSDQGSQFTGGEWQDFLKAHNLSCSMSRRGNCHDNAVAESFFQLLKGSGSSAGFTRQETKPAAVDSTCQRNTLFNNFFRESANKYPTNKNENFSHLISMGYQ